MRSRIQALLLLVSILIPYTASIAQKSGSRSNSKRISSLTGEQEAARFWKTYVAACGGSHYVKKTHAVFVELRGFRITMNYQPITQADILNGIEAKGLTAFTATAYRFFEKSSWQLWGNGIPESMHFVNSVRFQKTRGNWAFHPVGYFDRFAQPVNCSEVPGYRSESSKEIPTNSIEVNDYLKLPIQEFVFSDSNTNIAGDKFPQSTTTFVNWKIIYGGTAFTYSLPKVEGHWLKDGTKWSEPNVARFSNVGRGELWAGKGWAEPGHWELGKYTVKVYLRGQLVAERSFEIVPDDSLPGNMRFDGLYYQRFQDGSYWFFRFFEGGMVRDLGGPSRDNFESLLEDAWRCTNDSVHRYYNFDVYCKDLIWDKVCLLSLEMRLRFLHKASFIATLVRSPSTEPS